MNAVTYVYLPVPSQTWRAEFINGWVKEVNEGRGDNDTRPKVFCEARIRLVRKMPILHGIIDSALKDRIRDDVS